MKRMLKADSLFFYFFLSLLFIDIIFRLLTMNNPISFDLILTNIFSLSLAFIFYLICSLFTKKVNYLLSFFLMSFIALLYSSQFIYFKIFKTYFSMYSVGNGGQVIEFWKVIVDYLLHNAGWILLFFLPCILFLLFGKKRLTFEKIDGLNRISFIGCFILTQITAFGILFASGKETHSAYDLYYNNTFPVLSVEKLGLFTTMRVDLQRLLTGWSPKLEAIAPSVPVFDPITPPDNDEKEPKPNPGEPEIEKIEYNIQDIHFDKLLADETNPNIKEMHQYFSTVPPTEKNDYTGLYKGYNLIFITAEGFSPYAVHKEITPTLYKLVHEGYDFTNFYTPIWGVSTSDGEYVACTGLIPKSGVWSFQESGKNYLPFVMGNQLQKLDYETKAYHNHTYTYYGRNKSHPNMGYTYKGVGNGLQVKKTWPESDLEMFTATVPEDIKHQPFHTYYMTVSGHLQYSFTGNYIAHKNKQYVVDLPYSDQAKAYLATQVELDRALKYLLEELEKAGIADRTLIALSADHYPYGLEEKTMDELAGHFVERNFELYKNHFILYTKGMVPQKIDKPASSLDIIPTLSNLLGLEYDSRLLMGTDIFSNTEPLVIFSNKSFITEKGSYNSVSKEFVSKEVAENVEEYIQHVSSTIHNKFYYSTKILELDYYRTLFDQ